MSELNKSFVFMVIVTGMLALSLVLSGCSKQTEKAEDIRPVRAIKLDAAQQQVIAEYSGSVQPRIESRLGFRVSGKILTRKVDVGTLVKPGQVLMQLDPQDLQLAKTQAQANLTTAKTNFELATIELKRYQELRKTNAVGQSALDAKTTAAEAAKANLDQAEAGFKGQSNQASYTTLASDVEGVVTAINAEVGQVVAAGTPVVQVARINGKDAGETEVVVGIPENNVDIINHANQIQIRMWANPKEMIAGKVREVSPMADPATRTFTAKISVLNPSPAQAANIKLGMTAFVRFAVSTPNNFIKIPLTALVQEKGVTSVWVIEQGAVKLVPVQIGGVSGNDLVLTSGVTSGQTIVTAGVHLLKPGQKVTILDEEPQAPAVSDSYLSAQNVLAPQITQVNNATNNAVKVSGNGKASTGQGVVK